MFCVECGAEGPVYQGLCGKCFPKKHPAIAPVDMLDLSRCTSCGSFLLRSGWSKVDRDLALTQLLREAMPPLAPYERVGFTQVAREEDANNLAVTVKAVGRFQDLAPVQNFHLRVRIKPSLCDTCQKQRGRYFEGILQVRGEDRDLAPREIRAVRTFVAARVDRSEDREAFVSRMEEVDGGLDFYVSQNALAKGLARDLAGAFGGTVSSSPKLFGQREGREVYRVTALVRLGAFQKGDVVRHKGTLAEVTSVRPFVVLRDLETGESRRFKPKDVRRARRIDSERFEARLERIESGEVVAVHPESGERRPLRPTPRTAGPKGVVVWTPDGAYLSSLPADLSTDEGDEGGSRPK
jgi:nonsense-mediated mRNA decay protein 3